MAHVIALNILKVAERQDDLAEIYAFAKCPDLGVAIEGMSNNCSKVVIHYLTILNQAHSTHINLSDWQTLHWLKGGHTSNP
jgi:hypothetical protein